MNDLNVGGLPTAAALNAALLGRLATNLDLTQTQYEQARSAYGSVSAVLAADPRPPLQNSKVFPQGSFALATVVKPLDGQDNAFDVDLICRLGSSTALAPAEAKALIGTCLQADGRYRDKVKEHSRCWRINYANEFHLDVAPVVPNGAAGDWIPDRKLHQWIATHPEAFAAWFNKLADQARTTLLLEGRVLAKAEVVPFPSDPAERGWLRQLVQLLKRHREIWRQTLPPASREFAPISIIITTLAAYAFASIKQQQFATPLDLLAAIIDNIPSQVVQRTTEDGRTIWWIQSPVANENFANRWNENPAWPECFFAWCNAVATLFSSIGQAQGLDKSLGLLREAFGASVADRTSREYGEFMRQARETGQLRLKSSGLAVSSSAVGSQVRPHTFYGDV